MTTAFGFVSLQDLYAQRVTKAGIPRIFTAVRESADEYTRVMSALLSGFAERATVPQEQIELPGDGSLQPLDEDGNPLPVKPSGSYQVAYPIQGGGTAWGTNRVSRALMTVEEANRNTIDAMQRDADWMIRHMLAAVFDNVAWSYMDKAGADGTKGLGSITVQPLANNDTVIYTRKGNVAAAVDNHYLAQASAIDDTHNPFPTIEEELLEHPSNTGSILVYVSTSLKDSVMALSSFVETDDPNIDFGANQDLAVNVPSFGPGEEVLGYIKGTNCWVIHWRSMPAGYMLAKMANKAFLKMREYPAQELQGFFPEFDNVDGNHLVNRMLRYCGFGVSDRVAAVVYRVGNASYAIPTGYDAPLPA